MAFNFRFSDRFNRNRNGPVVNNPQHRFNNNNNPPPGLQNNNNNTGSARSWNNNNTTFAPPANTWSNPQPPSMPPVHQKKSLPPTEFQQNPGIYSGQAKSRNLLKVFGSLAFVIMVIVGVFVLFATGAGAGLGLAPGETAAPTAPPTPVDVPDQIPPFPNGIRVRDDDLVEILFESPPPDAAAQSFLNAAARWSEILAGNADLYDGRDSGTTVCTRNIFNSVTETHLRIFSNIANIDGPGQVVGRAGFCRRQFNSGLPSFGQMVFDINDNQGLINSGQFESVVLHEMGHVLGIGTLWENFNFIQDRVPNPNAPSQEFNPFYSGNQGLSAFRSLEGVGNNQRLLIENGFTNGGISGALGGGSINGHYSQTSVTNAELMTFRIEVRQPALSVVTIASLADFGFRVDIGKADFFQPFGNRRAFIENQEEDEAFEYVTLAQDIWEYTPEQFDD